MTTTISIAFHSLAFWEGQFVAKLSVTALAFPFVLGARRRWPATAGKERQTFPNGQGYVRLWLWRFALTFSWAGRGRRMAR